MNNIKMLYFDINDVSERNNVNKISASKQCDICHYRYFSNKSFKFQPYVCSRCHNLVMVSMNQSDIAILNTKNVDYCCIIPEISKSKGIKLLQKIELTEKKEHYKYREQFEAKNLLEILRFSSKNN